MSFLSTYHYLPSIISKRDSSADAICKIKQSNKSRSATHETNKQTQASRFKYQQPPVKKKMSMSFRKENLP